MIVKIKYFGKTYTLSNDNLQNGDAVYPISEGHLDKDGKYIHKNFIWGKYTCGFPNEPHIIKDLNYSDYKPYQIRTTSGYGPIEKYFKIIDIEII